MADSAWPSIYAERRALAQDLAASTSAQWSTSVSGPAMALLLASTDAPWPWST